MAARGIVGAAAYLPHRRLDRSTIAAVAGGGGGKGTRTVASYDEDTTTMGVEAARAALRPLDGVSPHTLWFSTVAPAYADKTNATAIHAALRFGPDVGAFDANGSVRSAMGTLHAALSGRGAHLVVSADLRSGLAGGPDESAFGDGAAALVVGDDSDGPVIAELTGGGWATEEFLDRWRTPGDDRSKVWEERFGETRYVPLGQTAWDDALKTAGLVADQVDRIAIAGPHARANAALAKKLAVGDRLVPDLAATVGNLGSAQPALLLTAALEAADPGQVIALVVLADGAHVLLFRTTDALASWTPARPVAAQVAGGRADPLRHLPALARPAPGRAAAPARAGPPVGVGGRPFGGVEVRLRRIGGRRRRGPPPAAAIGCHGRPDERGARGTIATFTVDRLAYSPSPPVVFAVVDFDGGGRLPVELTDVDVEQVRIGARVELTFRKLFTADGIHNYFWKARLTDG